MVERNSKLIDIYPQQDRFIKAIAEFADDPRQNVICFSDATAATGSGAWAPGRKILISAVRLMNSDVLIDSSTNLTEFNIDIEDGSGGKEHDLTAKANTVAVAADTFLDMTLLTDPVERTVEATEIVKIARTITLAQGECSLVFDYHFVD